MMVRTTISARPFRTVPGTGAAFLTLATAAPVSAQGSSPLLIMVTSERPQDRLTSMVLGMQSAQQGSGPHIPLCGGAGDLALRAASVSATAGQSPRDMSPQGLMPAIMDQSGAGVAVCAIHLPAKGIDGIRAADPAEIGALPLDPNGKVVSV